MSIELQAASVIYRRYAKPQHALWEWLSGKPRHQAFAVLQDISFTLAAGGSLGIVGDNGAGKYPAAPAGR
ncbi:MAG: hypothetical protein R3E89_01240 [Thiolinea sp.]